MIAAASWVGYTLFKDLARQWWDMSCPRLVKWLDDKLHRLLRGRDYRRRYYRKFIIPESRDFDIKGLATQGYYTLELNQVFVDLDLRESLVSYASGSVVQERDRGEEDRTIWRLLKRTSRDRRHYALIGPPGAGKTTLLKHIALVLTKTKSRRWQLGLPDSIPVLLYLRDHVERIQANQDTVITELIRARLPRKLRKAEPPGWFDHQLDRGRCVVMLDGLDEVADPETRKKVVVWLDRQIKQNHSNVFIVTSRPHGYRQNDLQLTTLEVLPFDEKQTESFVKSWYLATEVRRTNAKDEETRRRAKEAAEDLLRRLRNSPHLFELSANPLLLTMIANVHAYRGTLPRHRAELYAEVFDVFLSRRQEARGISSELTSPQKQHVLQELAYSLMRDRRRSAGSGEAQQIIQEPLARINVAPHKAEDFIDAIENTSGLLLRSQDQVRFAHPTFQEFLAAEHIRERGLIGELLDNIEEGWWQETIRLYAARADPTPVIEACLDRRSAPAIVLAVECEEEAVQVRPDVRERLSKAIARGVASADNDYDRRILGKAHLMLRLRDMDRVGRRIWVRPSLLTVREYQIFLDDRPGIARQPETLQLPGPENGSAAVAVTSTSDVQEFFAWLNREAAGRAWRYRAPRKGELDEATRLQCSDTCVSGYWTTDNQKLVVEPCIRPPFKWELQEALLWPDIGHGIPTVIATNRDCVMSRRVDGRPTEYELSFTSPIPDPSEWERDERAQQLAATFSLSDGSIPRTYPLFLAICLFKLGRLPNCHTLRLSTSPPQRVVSVDIRVLDELVNRLKLTPARIRHLDLDRIVERTGGLLNRMPAFLEQNERGAVKHRDLILQVAENTSDALTRALCPARPRELADNNDKELRWRVRMGCLLLAYEALVIREFNRNDHHEIDGEPCVTGSGPAIDPEETARDFIDMYASLALLEQRLKGNLRWTEGIRIMKEPSLESLNSDAAV
ncbi:MAG: NACHT domain-containing protein [Egibacteraceae bacterium]